MSLSYHPLPSKYISLLTSQKFFRVAVVGKDPFPTSPSGIPFCKPTWGEQLRDNCSGKHVLKSLGVEVEVAADNPLYPTPEELFLHLASQGIAFLNASYHFLGKGRAFPKYLYCCLLEANATNFPIVAKSERTLLLGLAKVVAPFIEEKYPHLINHITTVIHPDTHNRAMRPTEWHAWWLPNALKDELQLQINL